LSTRSSVERLVAGSHGVDIPPFEKLRDFKTWEEAQGLALALVSPSALLALVAYAGAGQVDWLVGLPLALGGIAAITVGVAFASRLPERRARLAFCGLLLITALLLALRG
jgi:uncharacterized membrane protein YfcA